MKNFSVKRLDPYAIIKDLIRNLWVVLLGALAATMLMVMYTQYKHTDEYTTTTTFVVMSKDSSNNVYYNLNAANTMANTFSSVLNSNALQQLVCDDLNLDSFDANVSTNIMGETNILQLRVTAKTPLLSYHIMQSIIKNYPSLTQFVSTSMVMNILNQPNVPTYSNTPLQVRGRVKKWFQYSFFAFLAIIILLSIRNDNKIHSQDDLTEKLDTKALGTIYYEKKKRKLGRKGAEHLLVTDIGASFSFVEDYRKIVTRIVKSMKQDQKIILVTSCRENEGKSTSAANIALTLAKSGKSVILIDGDLRRPSLDEIFGIKVEKGKSIASLLNNQITMNDYMYQYKNLPLAILFNDQGYADSTEILSSRKMDRLISNLREVADYIVIDSPPMSVLADAQVLVNYADTSVMVVQYNRVGEEEINDVIDTLRECNADFAGTILNGVKSFRFSDAVSGYGNYRYGRYGAYGKYGKYGKYGHYARTGTKKEEA